MAKTSRFSASVIDQTIRKNIGRLRKVDVLTVRPGFEIKGDQLTGNQAIVVTVNAKKDKAVLDKSEILPDQIGRYPVDVREASSFQRLRANDPAAAELTKMGSRPEEAEPAWLYEREMPSGKLITARSSDTQVKIRSVAAKQPATHDALVAAKARGKAALQIPYDPQSQVPPLPPLQQYTVDATITAHVSPDAGFQTLSTFLRNTRASLVIGMYDFTSGPILADFISGLSGTKKLQMVLDNPAPNDTRDQLDGITVEQLQSKLRKRAKIVRALSRADKFASKWMFPYAYHIKVIVRDRDSFWLSSGNLNNSNQPDPSHLPHKEDRDWHVIIESNKLAKLFMAYLNYDFQSALKNQQPNPAQIEKAIEDALRKKDELANPPKQPPVGPVKNPVAPQQFIAKGVNITPLLTPDKLPSGEPQYLSMITGMIKNATKSIYIQLQYIEASSSKNPWYQELLKALADKISQGLEVKLIQDNHWGQQWIEKMKMNGAGNVDLTNNIFMQSVYGVHNKGFVIDSRIVVVSSQNFSPAGVKDNRDAGLIIEHEGIAQYFEKVFLSDLKARTKPALAQKAPGGKAAKTTSRAKRRRKVADGLLAKRDK